MLDQTDIAAIISHALELTAHLDRQGVLRSYIESAMDLTGASYGALSILDSKGETIEFVYKGIDEDEARRIDSVPHTVGVFRDIPSTGALIINDLSSYAHAAGVPQHHPVMHNFLGTSIQIHQRTFGRLYLADKPEDFTQDDGHGLELLSRAAAIALENSRLYHESNVRAQWISTSRAITTALLEGTDEEEALELIASQMRRVARADVALIVLPSLGDTWVCEFADGEGAEQLIGVSFPPAGRAQRVIREGAGLIVDSMTRQSRLLIPELAHYGAALYAPMVMRGQTQGVIILLRAIHGSEFDLADLSMAENVARQAALALEFAKARAAQAQAQQIEDRAQISRDLHDLAIQQLFASGMELAAVRGDLAKEESVPERVLERLDTAIDSIDESVGQIRQIIYSLRDPEATIPILDRLRREVRSASVNLGFAPELSVVNFGEEISQSTSTQLDDELGSDIADDVIAVVRECLSNATRHAHASHVSVRVRVENQRVLVVVEDDGQGVSPVLSRRSGLSNLAARARRHHGTFSIRPGADMSGTKVEWMAFIE